MRRFGSTFVPSAKYHISTRSKGPVKPAELTLPTPQSHLRLPKGENEDVLKHNAFNLVMKLLYGKIGFTPTLESAHPILTTPRGVTPVISLLNEKPSSPVDAGMFAKVFLRQQKQIWHQYNQALQNVRAKNAATDSSSISAKNIFNPPSYTVSRVFSKKAAIAQRRSRGAKVQVTPADVADTDADQLLLQSLQPPDFVAHAGSGCKIGSYVSFIDMLTHHGDYFNGTTAAEDLFVASHFATTRSKTLSQARLRAMRGQYRSMLPASRYLYAPPGMLVRGYTPAIISTGKKVLMLEPLDQWLKRCKADILNFERFCLAKLSSQVLKNLNMQATTVGKHSSRARLCKSSEIVGIMDLFLMYRGLPTGRSKDTEELKTAQAIADRVTQTYNEALSDAQSDALPKVERNSNLTAIEKLDSVLEATPSEPLVRSLGLCSSEANHDQETAMLMSAYKQQTMLLRRQAQAFSPSLLSVDEISVRRGSRDVNSIVREAIEKGEHTYDVVAKRHNW